MRNEMRNEKTTAAIVRNGEVIAAIDTVLKNGTQVTYAYEICEEALDMSREWNLVNKKAAKISRAKKYLSNLIYQDIDLAKEINEKEFYVY